MTLEYHRLGCRCVIVMSVLMICSIHNVQCPMPNASGSQARRRTTLPLETSEVGSTCAKQGSSLTRCIAQAAVAAVRLLMPPGRRSQSVKKSRNYTADAIVLIPTTRSQREEIPEMLLLTICSRPDSIDVLPWRD